MGAADPTAFPPQFRQLEGAIDALLDRKLAQHGSRVEAVDEELHRQGTLLGAIAGNMGISAETRFADEEEGGDGAVARKPKDTIWCCVKCGHRIGFYDTDADVIRVRYKDFIAYCRVGIGGYLTVICRQCSETNVLNYEPGPNEEGLPVRDGGAVFDVETLEHLLAQAREAPDGTVTVRLLNLDAPKE
jgi:hypothetical protein